MGSDHTLYARVPGVVFFHKAAKITPIGIVMRRFISVIPAKHANDEAFKAQVAQGPVDAFRRLQESKIKREQLRTSSPAYDRLPMRSPDMPVEPKFGRLWSL
jgi:hypothetical protein